MLEEIQQVVMQCMAKAKDKMIRVGVWSQSVQNFDPRARLSKALMKFFTTLGVDDQFLR
jgi:hypothetical protein